MNLRTKSGFKVLSMTSVLPNYKGMEQQSEVACVQHSGNLYLKDIDKANSRVF